jgi:CCR4-NOT complex subunit CAF16
VLTCPKSQVLLLDEITVDLDVLGRADLMRFLVDECAARGATIIYATHIFDGLEFWPTHVAYVARGEQGSQLLSSSRRFVYA